MNVLSLFDYTGIMVAPWVEAGHSAVIVDEQLKGGLSQGGMLAKLGCDVRDIRLYVTGKPDILFGFPPCTDLAGCGAKHWAKKRAANPEFQVEAVALCRVVESLGNYWDIPWMMENPVSALSTLWRKPDHWIQPWEYGGYLPVDDVHPEYPEYIMPRDAYPKKTGIWCGNGFALPDKKPVDVGPGYSTQYKKLGGKSLKTKNIRSATPRGFARAVYLANRR
ncbi:hypothetical protein OAA60_00855 [Porticoccaceae bacterium]|nr:hypothetical protein [Porticoccaceae bacterium]